MSVVKLLHGAFYEDMHSSGHRRAIVDWNDMALIPSDGSRTLSFCRDQPSTIYRTELEQEAQEKLDADEISVSLGVLVGELFRDQAEPWVDIAEQHVLTVFDTVKRFVHVLLGFLTNEHTSAKLYALIEPNLEKLKEALMLKLDELHAYPPITGDVGPLPLTTSSLRRLTRCGRSGLGQKMRGRKPPPNGLWI